EMAPAAVRRPGARPDLTRRPDVASVRQPYDARSRRRPALLALGDLAWALSINGNEDRLATGKTSPVILIDSGGSQSRALGLTTNPRYRDGSRRTAVPHPQAVGLHK